MAESFTPEKLARDYDFLEKYIGLDKVYLETHRDRHDVSEDQIKWVKAFLEEKGVTVSGRITTTIHDFEGAEAGKRRIFETFCYTDPAMRERIKAISEYNRHGDKESFLCRSASAGILKLFACAVYGEILPAVPVTIREDFEEKTYYSADVILNPGVFRKYTVI